MMLCIMPSPQNATPFLQSQWAQGMRDPPSVSTSDVYIQAVLSDTRTNTWLGRPSVFARGEELLLQEEQEIRDNFFSPAIMPNDQQNMA